MRNNLAALLIGGTLAVASGTAAAGSNVSFSISFGTPAYYAAPVYAPPPVAYYSPAPVYYAPPVVYYSPPAYYAPTAVIRYDRGWGNRHHYRRHDSRQVRHFDRRNDRH